MERLVIATPVNPEGPDVYEIDILCRELRRLMGIMPGERRAGRGKHLPDFFFICLGLLER
jgi:hypothetical protein